MKIETIGLNEYVRTENGYISKNTTSIPWILKDTIINNSSTVEHSKNILDLIEVGDYVNGHKIIMNLQKSKEHYNTDNNFVTAVDYTFTEDEIKTILTKEQYNQNCFRLEE